MGVPLDDHLRQLLADEADERLGRLAAALTRVADGTDAVDRRLLTLEPHTVKGSAALAGLDDVERVARALEQSLARLPDDPDGATLDALLAAVGRVRALVHATLEGHPTGDADTLVGTLEALPGGPT